MHAEQAVWVRVRSCLDKYAQRTGGTAASPFRGPGGVAVGGGSEAVGVDEYTWLVQNCPKLLAGFRDSYA